MRENFERMLYSEMFSFLIDNGLISQNQWGFKPGDSYIKQLLSITREMCKSVDDRLDVCDVLLDIFKAFDEVWHKGLKYKFKQVSTKRNGFH